MKTLGLITARGGSKGIPHKNVKILGGKPLIVWSIEAALRSTLLDAVVVSTDDPAIATVAREAGAEVPFIRPKELAQDQTAGIDPVLHALSQLPQFDSVLLLQPTSPLRSTEDIDNCLKYAKRSVANALVSVSEPITSPFWTYRIKSDQTLEPLIDVAAVKRRQDLPEVFALNGALYFAKTSWLVTNRTFTTAETMAFVMPSERSIDIDTMLDWKLAEILLAEQSC